MTKRLRKTLDITEMDIIAELDAIRERPDPRASTFTLEQDLVLWHARGPHQERKIPWNSLKTLWEKHWPQRISEGTLRNRLAVLVEQGGPKKE